MTEEEKIQAGILFCPNAPTLKAIKLRTHKLNLDFNQLYEDQAEKRNEFLQQMLGELGENSFIQGPVFFHYGIHTKIGKNFFSNFNLTIQDDGTVTIGDNCNFGPNVTIVTPCHPLLPEERRAMQDAEGSERHFCYAKPVKIGNDCWLGANVVICPGVTIGDGCVIGAGSVVTRNIESYTVAAGNPCRIIRKLSKQDSMAYRPEILADNKIM